MVKPVVTADNNFRLSSNHEKNKFSSVMATLPRNKQKPGNAGERDYESTQLQIRDFDGSRQIAIPTRPSSKSGRPLAIMDGRHYSQ